MHHSMLLSSDELTLFMDYGQFVISGGLGEWDDRMDGLNHAMADPPSYSDGTTIVVVSPHQNNFDMKIVVETWSHQPPSDGDQWQQVSVERLTVGLDARIVLSSPPGGNDIETLVPAGEYLVEISGRGFVNYGWPGDTKPGDDWRLRLWPDDGSPRPEPQRWHMPGYGVPPSVPYRPPVPQPDHIGPPQSALSGPKLESLPDPGLLRALGIRTDSDEDTDPVTARVDRYNGGGILAVFDRDLIAEIIELDPERQRAIAIWCVEQAFTHAGLGDRTEFTSALAALRAGEPLPEAVADPTRGFETFRPGDLAGDGTPLDTTTETVGVTSRIVIERVSLDPHPGKHYLFHEENMHRGYAAIPALSAAADPDPLRAAIEALFAATIAHAPNPEAFHAQLKLLLSTH